MWHIFCPHFNLQYTYRNVYYVCGLVWMEHFIENEWQIYVACDQHSEFIFLVCNAVFFFLSKHIYNIESCHLICFVHVLIENNVFRIRNCTCRCVIVYVYVLCSNTNQIRWAETVVIVVGVVVAAVHCAITAKCQQIKQKLICLLTKDHTST